MALDYRPANGPCRVVARQASRSAKVTHMDGAAGLAGIRSRTQAALDGFLAGQRAVLTLISPDLDPAAEAITDLVAGGKRLRPAFCYWGWRACGGQDEPSI